MTTCPIGLSLSDCNAIQTARSILPEKLYDLTYADSPSAIVTPVTALPPQLQSALSGCTTPGGCKAIGYNFSSVTNTPEVISSLPFVYDTKMTSQVNNALIVKSDLPPPPVLVGLPGYDSFSNPFEKRNLFGGGTIKVEYTGVPATGNTLDKCADTCNKGSDCAGFNFVKSVGTCDFFPTGAVTNTQQNPTEYATDEWVKRFDSSSKGMGYRKKPIVTVGTNSTIPAAVDLSTTGRFCRDFTKCNTIVSRILDTGEITRFDTSDLAECSLCPSRRYATNGTAYTVVNEMNLSTTFPSKTAAKTALTYAGGLGAVHNNPDFSVANRIVTIKKLDGTVLFSNFNTNVSGTGTVSVNWKDAKNETRKIRYEPIDYVTDGYMIQDAKDFYSYCATTQKFEQALDPKYSPNYTSNVYIIT